MDTFLSLSRSKKEDNKFSSGVFMTVWQSAPTRPEVQILMRQENEIEQLKLSLDKHEARLNEIEARLHEMENIVNTFASTFTLILDQKD